MSNHVLFEIGVEELPARFISQTEQQLQAKTEDWLKSLRISCESIQTFSTPRRLAVLLTDVQEKQETLVEEARGPALKIAQNEDGEWTKAAIGFSKGQGKSTDDIYTKEVKGVPYIFIEKTIEGKATSELLPTFKDVIEHLTFPQTMRWGEHSLRFSRPIRWLVALHNDQVIPFSILNVKTGNKTFGHRFLSQETTINDAAEYEKVLKENHVIVDANERQTMIKEQLVQLQANKNCTLVIDDDLLNEVTHLVEYPTVFFGDFDDSFLSLPEEVLITSMIEHQRYFPTYDEQGDLLPHFVGVRNGDDYKLDNVVRGNEKVLRARLTDAQFFYEEDLKQSIPAYQETLERVVFQEKLGTMKDKVDRIVAITNKLCDALNVTGEEKSDALRVAELCKFDLTTHMVNEFTELQGVIGEKYAIYFGEKESVAQGIKEHYMPLQATSELPSSLSGAIVSIADKLDTIIGFISVGLTPSGSQDPYGLRRQAFGILRILREEKLHLKLETMITIVKDTYETVDAINVDNVTEFFKLRASYLLKSFHIEQDVIDAILENDIGLLSYTIEKARTLSEKRSDDSFRANQEALLRVLNIAKSTYDGQINSDLFETSSEKALYDQLKVVKVAYEQAVNEENAIKSLQTISTLGPYIHEFFENNMVMHEDEQIKNNRIALLSDIGQLIRDYADLSKVQWKHQ
ncbi:MAG TPA: glycine--tRNA ligase subunit beta [Bacillota bacterium]|nr:glycine--tRNA ligase subunit beta [Bacillota bacterium]